MQALRVDAIGDSGQEYGGQAFRDCLTAARARGVRTLLVRRGMRYLTGDGVVFDALAPSEPLLADGPNDVNENSVVLMLTYPCPGCAHPFQGLGRKNCRICSDFGRAAVAHWGRRRGYSN